MVLAGVCRQSYEHPPSPGHAAELPFVFHNLDEFEYTQEELHLADSVSQFWGNFVKYGNPNGESGEQGEGYCAEEECKVRDMAQQLAACYTRQN